MPSLLTDLAPTYGSVETPLFGEAQVLDPSGVPVQERLRRTTPAWRVDLSWTDRRGADIATLREFCRTLKTTGATAYLYTPDQWGYWAGLAIGTGDGTLREWTMPVRDCKPESIITVNAAAKTAGTDYELGVENRAVYSEDFSQTAAWVAGTGETITRTGGQTDPLGGSAAWLLAGDAAGSSTKKLYQTITTPASGTRVKVELWMYNYPLTGGGNDITVSCGQSSQVVTAQGAASLGWQKLSFHVVANGSTAVELSFTTAAIGLAIRCALWHPLICYGTSEVTNPAEWPYIPTHSAAITAATLGRWKVAFYAAVTNGHAIVASIHGRRLLLGRLVSGPAVSTVGFNSHALSASFIGEESSGA